VRRRLLESFYRLAASGLVPRRWVATEPPAEPARADSPADPPAAASADPPAPGDRPLKIEIVSHCWRYSRFLAYQLSSLALRPPTTVTVEMTVFYSPEDRDTAALLERFGALAVHNVRWRWRALETTRLFRRAIGRNMAALETDADWIWFSDCDVVFHDGALDAAASVLRGRTEGLVFPRVHRVSDLLEDDDARLRTAEGDGLVDIDPGEFHVETRDKAVGGFQIVRGDLARAAGYCAAIPFYQEPVPDWQKTYEDRTFRWLLGTDGEPVEIPGLYRIRHAAKGRDPARAGRARTPGDLLRAARVWLRRRRQR
jgi:hypothetical protein